MVSQERKERKLHKMTGILRLLFLALCVAGVSRAWFSQKEYTGYAVKYVRKLLIGNSNRATIVNYYAAPDDKNEIPEGTDVTADGYIAIENSENGEFTIANLNPGERAYFKTEIINETAQAVSTDLFLTGVRYSDVLNNAIHFIAIQPYAYDGYYAEVAVFEKGEQENTRYLSSVQISDDITIPKAATDEEGNPLKDKDGKIADPGVVTIYWCIEIDGSKAGNECEDAWITIGQMQLASGS